MVPDLNTLIADAKARMPPTAVASHYGITDGSSRSLPRECPFGSGEKCKLTFDDKRRLVHCWRDTCQMHREQLRAAGYAVDQIGFIQKHLGCSKKEAIAELLLISGMWRLDQKEEFLAPPKKAGATTKGRATPPPPAEEPPPPQEPPPAEDDEDGAEEDTSGADIIPLHPEPDSTGSPKPQRGTADGDEQEDETAAFFATASVLGSEHTALEGDFFQHAIASAEEAQTEEITTSYVAEFWQTVITGEIDRKYFRETTVYRDPATKHTLRTPAPGHEPIECFLAAGSEVYLLFANLLRKQETGIHPRP